MRARMINYEREARAKTVFVGKESFDSGQQVLSLGKTRMKVDESSNCRSRLAWNSHALSCALIDFERAQFFLRVHESVLFRSLTLDDSRPS